MRKLVIYDMDKTITRRPTYSAFLLCMAWSRAPWRLLLIPISALYGLAYLVGLISRSRLKELNLILFVGRTFFAAELAPHIDHYADQQLRTNSLQQARERIETDKAAGCTIMMATASFELYTRIMGTRLGCDVILGTRLLRGEDGRTQARLDGENCYGDAKLDRIMEWLDQEGGRENWDIIRCYSDHVSDAPMLELASDPIATNPHPPLQTMADQRGWTTVSWQ